MPDDKRGREKQARDADMRQRERAIETELERSGETEPPVDPAELGEFEVALETLEFPATGAEVVAAVGDRAIESDEGTYTIEELVPETDEEAFDSPAEIREQVQRPSVAAAMKPIVEASDPLQDENLGQSQRNAYEKTFRELKAISPEDDDEGVHVISDWIVEQIREKGKLPGSRDVRRRAAEFCRANGYEVGNNDWLGV